MLIRCLRSERMKMKNPAIWLTFLLIPVLPAIIGTGNYRMNLAILKNGWYSLWTQHTLFYATFFYAPLIAIYCAWLFRVEHLNHNWNMIMTVPVSVQSLFFAKLLVLFRMTVLTQLWVGILYVICGKWAGLPGLPPLQILSWLLRGCVGGMVIAVLQLLFSMWIRSFSVPVVIALLGSVAGLLLNNEGAGMCWPWSLMLLGMNANQTEDMLAGNAMGFVLGSAVFLVLFTAVGIQWLKKADIRA